MDPLSLTASTITLIDSAAKIFRFLESIPTADKKFAELCVELKHLKDGLQSINAMRADFLRSPLNYVCVDQDLWKQSEIALSDCKSTLDDLASVVERIERPMQAVTVLNRLRLATTMQLQAKEIESFKEKLRTSASSLQTLLGVLNVSLSLRSNTSLEMVNQKLKILKRAIDKFHQATTYTRPELLERQSDRQLLQNQKQLVRAARDFWSTASNTASRNSSTISETQQTNPDLPRRQFALGSVVSTGSDVLSSFPSTRRREVELWHMRNQQTTRSSSTILGPSTAAIAVHEDVITAAQIAARFQKAPNSPRFNLDEVCFEGMSKLAQKAIRDLDFTRAEQVLREILRQQKPSEDSRHNTIRLRTQLILIGFIQNKGRDMEASVLDLVQFHVHQNIGNQLLYLLTLDHLKGNDYESSQRTLQRLLSAPSDSMSASFPTENQILQLVAASYHLSGNCLRRDAIEAVYPKIKSQGDLPNIVDFILSCNELVLELFNLADSSDIPILKKTLSDERRQKQDAIKPNRIHQFWNRSRRLDNTTPPTADGESEVEDDTLSERSKDGHTANYFRKRRITNGVKWSSQKLTPILSKLFPRRKIRTKQDSLNLDVTIDNRPNSEREVQSLLTSPRPSANDHRYQAGSLQLNIDINYEDTDGSFGVTHVSRQSDHDELNVTRPMPSSTAYFNGPKPVEIVTADLLHPHGEKGSASRTGSRPSLSCLPSGYSYVSELEGDFRFKKLPEISGKKLCHILPILTETFNSDQSSSSSSSTGVHIQELSRRRALTMLYSPPVIAYTKADILASIRLALALSRCILSPTAKSQHGTMDSGYGSGPGGPISGIPGETRHVSHERLLCKLMGLKVIIPGSSEDNSIKGGVRYVGYFKPSTSDQNSAWEQHHGDINVALKSSLTKATNDHSGSAVQTEIPISNQSFDERSNQDKKVGGKESAGRIEGSAETKEALSGKVRNTVEEISWKAVQNIAAARGESNEGSLADAAKQYISKNAVMVKPALNQTNQTRSDDENDPGVSESSGGLGRKDFPNRHSSTRLGQDIWPAAILEVLDTVLRCRQGGTF